MRSLSLPEDGICLISDQGTTDRCPNHGPLFKLTCEVFVTGTVKLDSLLPMAQLSINDWNADGGRTLLHSSTIDGRSTEVRLVQLSMC